MENNDTIIPNVSSVFRELVKLSHTNPKLHSNLHSNDQFKLT